MNRNKNAEPNPKLHVGLNKKIGMPDYGSVGAHCTIEWEIDRETIAEPEVFQRRVRNAFDTCRSAVEEELSRHNSSRNSSNEGSEQRERGNRSVRQHPSSVATRDISAGVEIRRLIKTKQPKLTTHRYLPRTDRQIERFFDLIREYLDALQRNRFSHRPSWQCDTCEHAALCTRELGC